MARSILVAGSATLALTLTATLVAQQTPHPSALTADELTAIHSAVSGGAAAPQWAPDGSSLMFASALGSGSDLWMVPSTGGFPVSLHVDMGDIAFLQTHQAKYSPDGKWISYISNRTGAAELFAHSVDDGRDVQITRLGARINSYSWSPDSKPLALAVDQYGNYDISTVRVPSGESARLTTETLNDVFPVWTPDGAHVVYVRLDDRWADHEILIVDANGSQAARAITKDTDFFDYAEGGNFGYPLVSPDGKTLLFRSQRSGWVNYWAVPMTGGTPRPVAPEPANQSGARWSPDGRSSLYLALWNGTQDLRVANAAGGGGAPRVVTKPADMGVVANAEWSPDGSRLSFTMETPVAPSDLYVVSATGGAPTQLTNSTSPGYVERALIRPRKVTYRSADGLTIAAYLYEPILAPGQKAPGILLIHGGPTASFNDTYQVQAQYFAMRGYAVLLPNIRGSSGYGRQFEDANNGCWGRCDLKDVAAGVEFLKRQPSIEPTRMGITGTSYGGCMTLAAAAFAPGLFQAGIAASGYGDWLQFYAEQELRHIKLLNYELGPLPQQEKLYRSLSPIYYVDSIQTPLFLLHGEGKQLPRSMASRQFADRLEFRYKAVKYKAYPNENYYIQSPANIRVMLGDMLEYFDQYLRDGVREPESRIVTAGAKAAP
jgi:dipeptidyl aminopeptidase/acylaminoacyl peptidase